VSERSYHALHRISFILLLMAAFLTGCGQSSSATFVSPSPAEQNASPATTDTALFPTATPVPIDPMLYSGPAPAGALARLGKGEVLGTTFSPDGQYLAIMTSLGIILYRTNTLEQEWFTPFGEEVLQLGTYDQLTSNNRSISFNPDGSLIAASLGSDGILLWDNASGAFLYLIVGEPGASVAQTGEIRYWAFSPDGDTLIAVTGSLLPTITEWDARTGQKVVEHFLSEENEDLGMYYPIAMSPDGKTLVFTLDEEIVLWDMSTDQTLHLPDSKVEKNLMGVDYKIAFSGDGQRIAITAHGRPEVPVKLWDTNTGALLQTLTAEVYHMELNQDGTRLATVREGNMDFYVWDMANGALLFEETHPDYWIMRTLFAPDDRSLITASSGSIVFWDAANGTQLATLEGYDAMVSMVFGPDGNTLFSASGSSQGVGQIVLWAASSGALKGKYGTQFTISSVESLAINPLGDVLVCSSLFSGIVLLDSMTGEYLQALGSQSGTADKLVFSSTGSYLASGSSYENATIIWDTATWQQLHTLEGLPVIFGPNATILVTVTSGESEGTVALWDTTTWSSLHTFEGSLAALSLDGNTLATVGDRAGLSGNSILLWDPSTGESLGGWVIELDRGQWNFSAYISSLAFNPEGNVLATGTADGSVILWDVNAGVRLHSFIGHMKRIADVAFSPDGNILASLSNDGTIVLWNVSGLFP
jgi:WD40 repeat protein